FKTHPAVAAYARIAADPRRLRALKVLFFGLSDPPSLDWNIPAALVPPEREAFGGEKEFALFREQVRDFVRVSGYEAFFAEHRAAYDRVEAAARASLAGRDYPGLIEGYVGPLDARLHVILSLAYRAGTYRYILPYPYQRSGAPVSGPFDVFVIAEPSAAPGGVPRFEPSSYWNELLDVAVDPILAERCAQIDRLRWLLAPVARECPEGWQSCVVNMIKRSVQRRIAVSAGGDPNLALPGDAKPWTLWTRKLEPAEEYERAFGNSLREYERRRDVYKTLRDFYPKLAETLEALGKRGAPSAPATPPECAAK